MKQRLLAEERKRCDRNESNDDYKNGAVFIAKKNKFLKFNGKCHNCGKEGHMKINCRSKREANLVNNTKNNHQDAEIVNFEEDDDEHVCFMVNNKNIENYVINFILDSGSSDHLVNDRTILHNVTVLKNPIRINVAKDNEMLIANEVGEVNGYTNFGRQEFYIKVVT